MSVRSVVVAALAGVGAASLLGSWSVVAFALLRIALDGRRERNVVREAERVTRRAGQAHGMGHPGHMDE